jgi:hypothetical protein
MIVKSIHKKNKAKKREMKIERDLFNRYRCVCAKTTLIQAMQ